MKSILPIICISALTAYALAESPKKYIMVVHSLGTDPFWPVAGKGALDAGKELGVDIEYLHPTKAESFDQFFNDMSKHVLKAKQADGLIVSMPRGMFPPLSDAVKSVIDAGKPVIVINSGKDTVAPLGAKMYVGQDESTSGLVAGKRAAREGASKSLCLNQEAFNSSLVERCNGYFQSVPGQMIETTNNYDTIKTRVQEALQKNPDIDSLLAVGPHVCEITADVVRQANRSLHLSCFDVSPGVINKIKSNEVAFSIDQQQRLQGYLPVVYLNQYNKYVLMPYGSTLTGPAFVDKTNADNFKNLAGTYR